MRATLLHSVGGHTSLKCVPAATEVTSVSLSGLKVVVEGTRVRNLTSLSKESAVLPYVTRGVTRPSGEAA